MGLMECWGGREGDAGWVNIWEGKGYAYSLCLRFLSIFLFFEYMVMVQMFFFLFFFLFFIVSYSKFLLTFPVV